MQQIHLKCTSPTSSEFFNLSSEQYIYAQLSHQSFSYLLFAVFINLQVSTTRSCKLNALFLCSCIISGLINMDSYKLNGEWEIYSTMVKRNEFFYDCCPNERFANVAFALYMRRRHTFYVLNVILPSIMTSVLLLSVFFCTPGQKVNLTPTTNLF